MKTLLDEVKAGRLDPRNGRAFGALNAAGARVKPPRVAALGDLSEREVEVLLWVARGLTNTQIGKKLSSSRRAPWATTSQHIYDKTDARTRAAAALFAVRHGLVGAAATAK